MGAYNGVKWRLCFVAWRVGCVWAGDDNEWVGVSCHVGSGVNEECDPIGVRDLLLYHQKNVTR